jgi:hypothetical protein
MPSILDVRHGSASPRRRLVGPPSFARRSLTSEFGSADERIMIRRSLLTWLGKKNRGRPGLKPEMRGLIDSFDAHLHRPTVARDDEPGQGDPETGAATKAEAERSR